MLKPKMAAPASGMEMMLRSMGLGEIIEAAKQLATNGTVERILQFADQVGELNERLARIERLLDGRAGGPPLVGYSDTAHGGPGEPAGPHLVVGDDPAAD